MVVKICEIGGSEYPDFYPYVRYGWSLVIYKIKHVYSLSKDFPSSFGDIQVGSVDI